MIYLGSYEQYKHHKYYTEHFRVGRFFKGKLSCFKYMQYRDTVFSIWKNRVWRKWTGMKELAFLHFSQLWPFVRASHTVHLHDMVLHIRTFTDEVKYAGASSFRKTVSQFPVLIILHWRRSSLQHCKSSWMNSLCVRLKCLQIILVYLMKQFLLPENHVLFGVDHHNAATALLSRCEEKVIMPVRCKNNIWKTVPTLLLG